MTTIYYREVNANGYNHSELTEEFGCFDLKSFAEMCEQSPEWVLQLLEYDILTRRAEHKIHQFSNEDLERARQAYRLQRDFNASFSAVAMMLDLIDEVQQLRKQVKQLDLKQH